MKIKNPNFSANKILTGGLALQTLDRLKKCDVEYVHPIQEHSWGQRVVRIIR